MEEFSQMTEDFVQNRSASSSATAANVAVRLILQVSRARHRVLFGEAVGSFSLTPNLGFSYNSLTENRVIEEPGGGKGSLV
jgi:hypothetical protein